MPLENLDDLEASWTIFLEEFRPGSNKLTQDAAWRRDSPGEWTKLKAYYDGTGPRPTLTTATGRRMVEVVDAIVEARGAAPPPPPTSGIITQMRVGWNGDDPRERASYPGFEYAEVSNDDLTVNMTAGKPYFVKIVEPIRDVTSQSDPDAFMAVNLVGGNHAVIVGGDVAIDSGAMSGRQSEPLGIFVQGGDDGGIVYLEGLRLRANNPITIRSRRAVRVQQCVLEAFAFPGSGAHSDLAQAWGTTTGPGGHLPCEAIWMNYVTCYTDYTGFSVLVQKRPAGPTDLVAPKTWFARNVDIHPRMVGDLGEAGNYAYHSSSEEGGNGPGWQNFGPYTVYDREIYAELPQGGGGAYVRGIDDIVCLRSLRDGAWVFPYEIKNPSGQILFQSTGEPTGGSGSAAARTPWNYLTFDRVPPLAKQKWIVGQPPASKSVVVGTGVKGQERRVFVPTPSVGMTYDPVV